MLNKPPPDEEDDVYYAGFCILGGRRLYSQVGPQPLPLTEILAYMDELCMSDMDDRETFLSVVTDLDHCELTILSKAKSK